VIRLRLLQLLVRVGDRVPTAILYALARAAGTVAWFASGTLRRTTRDHMRHVYPAATPRSAIDRAARGAVCSAALYYVDFARTARLRPDAVFDQIDALEGIDALFRAYDRGRGVILASAHLGNPEFIAPALAPLFPIMVLTERLAPPALNDFVHGVRGHSGVRFVPADRHGVREALEQLRCGGVLGMLVDRDVLGTGEPFPFFGERASMPRGAVELAWLTGAAIVVGFVTRSGAGRYRIALHEVAVPSRGAGSGERGADIEAGMRSVLAAIEDGIRSAPDQWFPLSPIWTYGLTPDSGDRSR